ncbi:unnamed protein product [Prunus brigantina]
MTRIYLYLSCLCSKIQRFNKTNIKALQLAKRNANNNHHLKILSCYGDRCFHKDHPLMILKETNMMIVGIDT